MAAMARSLRGEFPERSCETLFISRGRLRNCASWGNFPLPLSLFEYLEPYPISIALVSMDPALSHLDRIAALLAATPPRHVPPELRRAAMRQTAPLLFILIGAVVAAFGMIFVVGFFPWNLTQQWKLDASRTATTTGKIVALEPTAVSIGKRNVMRTTFEYSPPQTSGIFRGTCYTTGSRWSLEEEVKVLYRANDPSIACVEGARLTKTGGMAAFVLIIPGIGATLMGIGLTLRHRTMRILVHGHVTDAHVTAIEPTATQINDTPVFQIRLQRVDRPDDPPIQIRKWDPAVVAFARQRLESKMPVFVLFDPQRPNRALLPEVL
jgi:hypothetical protein